MLPVKGAEPASEVVVEHPFDISLVLSPGFRHTRAAGGVGFGGGHILFDCIGLRLYIDTSQVASDKFERFLKFTC